MAPIFLIVCEWKSEISHRYVSPSIIRALFIRMPTYPCPSRIKSKLHKCTGTHSSQLTLGERLPEVGTCLIKQNEVEKGLFVLLGGSKRVLWKCILKRVDDDRGVGLFLSLPPPPHLAAPSAVVWTVFHLVLRRVIKLFALTSCTDSASTLESFFEYSEVLVNLVS